MSDSQASKMMETLIWKKFPVLDQGWVCLVDWMGDDAAVVQAARVSYGAGTKTVSDDRTLIRYLYRHSHTTPFEMAEVKLLVRVPMDCWRQWIRHRTASVNEYSTRYSEAIDACQKTHPGDWRAQAKDNRQGSAVTAIDWPAGPADDSANTYGEITAGQYLSNRESDLQRQARQVYEERIKFGIAREQARKDLPLSTYTEAYWKVDLLNLFRFLSLRMDGHAQQEIREYATIIGEQIVAPLFPLCWEAFLDYDMRRGGVLLSRLDRDVIAKMWTCGGFGRLIFEIACAAVGWPVEGRCRERDECWDKLLRLGLVQP